MLGHFPVITSFLACSGSDLLCQGIELPLLWHSFHLLGLLISVAVSSLTHRVFRSVAFNFYILVNVSHFLLLLIFYYIPLCLDSILIIYWYLKFCVLPYGLFWRMFHVHLRMSVYILLLLGGVLINFLRCSWLLVAFKSVSLLISYLVVLLLGRVLKSLLLLNHLFLTSVSFWYILMLC